ncbi:hypothetical protein PJN93_32495, partial [Mycobacterium kansasii]
PRPQRPRPGPTGQFNPVQNAFPPRRSSELMGFTAGFAGAAQRCPDRTPMREQNGTLNYTNHE